MAYALYDSFRLIRDSGLAINYPLVLNEGGAKSQLWRQIITDVFDVPTALVERRTGAPFGDALLAGVAVGLFEDFAIAKEWTRLVEPMAPNREHHERYMAYFDLFKSIYGHLKGDMEHLATIRQ